MAEFVRLAGGRALQDQLFELGVEFPCGGASACGGCRVRLIDGEIPVTEGMRDALSEDELAAGWRLACQGQAVGTVTLDIEQWSAKILTDESKVSVEPAEGFGAVIDLGTTTLVVEVVDLETGDVVSVLTGLNPQGRHGSDVMSRIEFDLRHPGVLTALIRGALGAMVAQAAGGRLLREVLVCGNTVMHHLFCGESVEPLSHVPFASPALGARLFDGVELGWNGVGRVTLLGCAGGFVGSDLIAGLVACGMHEASAVMALMDLGTNGEIAVGNRERVVCASTAAGPAFEGGRIRMGMRAGDGAIDRVERDGCHVIGGGAAVGICGSGLVDAVAMWLDMGIVAPSGRFADAAKPRRLAGDVELSQADVRELQLAKGAIAAGLDLLRRRMGLEPDGISSIHLAGAFGNYVRVASARRIGLLPAWDVPVVAAGNSAVRGTRALLLSPSRREAILDGLLGRMEHVELAADAEFQEAFVENMLFPR
ncbi:MAG: DUF4445 domain-containing protein [Acidobacteria bacterium]|nr:DUF4445 domain-containing protein [Acidobacteriota bacterium]